MRVDTTLSASDQHAYPSRIPARHLQFVGLHAPLDLIEQRERERGDRMLGLARWQWDRVHKGIDYDFELDVADCTPDAVARLIAEALAIPVSAPEEVR